MGKLRIVWKSIAAALACVAALGALVLYLGDRAVRARALEVAEHEVGDVAELFVEPAVAGIDLDRLSATQRTTIATTLATHTVYGASPDYRLWSDDLELVHPRAAAAPPSAVGRALTGGTSTRLLDNNEIHVVVPVGLTRSPLGALEARVPYDVVAGPVWSDLRPVIVGALVGICGVTLLVLAIVIEASRRLRRQAEVSQYQAMHDSLTGLANRALFQDRVQQAIALAARESHILAVMLMDLDRFKDVNDTLGHHKGDVLLQQVARRLEQTLRETDTIARLGGDEFALLLPSISDPAAAINVAEKIRIALRQPFVVEGMTLDVRGSIGISFFPGHGEDVDVLLQRADVAMYLAKAAHSDVEVYTAERDQHSPARLALVTDLRHALEHDELTLYYQPKVDLRTSEADTVEALVRWKHPMKGLIPPDEFIPLAEHTGLIEGITMYVLDRALEQIARWREQGLDLAVAVNISPRNLLDSNFPQTVASMLKKWGVPPGFLQLEITESTLVHDPPRAIAILARLDQMRIEMSIDDFGTGFSSLAHLRRLPVKELKIDKSFVLNMTRDKNDEVIVRSTIDLGRNLGLRVVAEGVENAEIWRQLVVLGCDQAQGYYRSHPMPAEEIPRWLTLARPRWPL